MRQYDKDGNHKWENRHELNTMLIQRQQITEAGIKELELLHDKREEIESYMYNESNPIYLRGLSYQWTTNQLQLQMAWGFTPDESYHKYWLVPRCTCPKLDNEDRWPNEGMFVNDNCPVHGRAAVDWNTDGSMEDY